MRLVILGLITVLGLLACDDGGEVEETQTGQLNGERCLATGGGARICAGATCYRNLPTDAFGVCAEACTNSCRFGGDCLAQPDLPRICLARCESNAQCGAHATCQALPEADQCTEAGCSPSTYTYCIPFS